MNRHPQTASALELRKRLDRTWLVKVSVMVGGLALAAVAGVFPLVVVSSVALLVAAYAMVRWSLARLSWLCFGAVFVLQVGDGVTPAKLVYVAGVAFAVVLALLRLPATCRSFPAGRMRPALLGAGILATWILVIESTYSILVEDVDVSLWFRDGLTYLLISAGVLIGLDAASDTPGRYLRWSTFAFGAVAAGGFAVTWLGRRGFSDVQDGRSQQMLLASLCALLVPISLAFALGLARRRSSGLLLAYAALLIASVLITGTRTGLILLLIPLGMLGTRKFTGLNPSRVLGGYVLVLGIAAVSVAALFTTFTDAAFVRARVDSLVQTITQGVEYDASGAIRLRAYASTWDIFTNNALLGQGMGRPFPNPNPLGGLIDHSPDTPWAYLAKFGVIGAAVVAVALVLIGYGLLSRHGQAAFVETSAVRGAVIGFLGLLPFGAYIEDKGFSLGIALAVSLVAAAARDGGPGRLLPPATRPAPRRTAGSGPGHGRHRSSAAPPDHGLRPAPVAGTTGSGARSLISR